MAALLAVDAVGGDLEAAVTALSRYRGVGRRFDRVGAAGGVDVVDDYAHHPSELVATLEAARQAFPGRRLVAVFQPHLYSRTELHGDAMGTALAAADLVVVTEIYAAREQPLPGVSGRRVADAAKAAGGTVHFEADRAGLGRMVASHLRSGRRRADPGCRRHHARGSGAGRPAAAAMKPGWYVLGSLGLLGRRLVPGPEARPAARLLRRAKRRGGGRPVRTDDVQLWARSSSRPRPASSIHSVRWRRGCASCPASGRSR